MKKRTEELILQSPEKFAHHDRVFLNNPVSCRAWGWHRWWSWLPPARTA